MDSGEDSPFDPAVLEAGRKLFAGRCDFMLSCVAVAQLPPANLPEVAFAGRSNVGKSTLVNALTGRKSLARTSNTPGRTQQLNFFDLGGRMRLVDMPGYGFAKAPKKAVEDWTKLIHDYLRGRPTLRRVCVLVDSRHGLKPADLTVMKELDSAAVQYRIVLTKADKPKSGAVQAVKDDVEKALKDHPAAAPDVFLTSAEKGWGVAELRADLGTLAEPASLE